MSRSSSGAQNTPLLDGDVTVAPRRGGRTCFGQTRAQTLEAFGNRCCYCGLPFGGVTYRRGRPIFLRLQWDHFEPAGRGSERGGSRKGAGAKKGEMPSCQICNAFKRNRVFANLEHARSVLEEDRLAKGYQW